VCFLFWNSNCDGGAEAKAHNGILPQCDRQLPCTNCVSRNKQSACQYEKGAPTAKQLRNNNGTASSTSPDDGGSRITVAKHDQQHIQDLDDEYESTTDTTTTVIPTIPTKATAFGYSHTGINTLDFLTRIETATDTPSSPSQQPFMSSAAAAACTTPEAFATRDRYRSLIRQLPPRAAIERLSGIYFTEFNWQYDVLDRAVFDAQLGEWYRQPFTLLSGGGPGPGALDVELRAFPAVVFQVCAVALLTLDDDTEGEGERGVSGGREGSLEGLKYAGGMTFEDLAREYSESGMEILTVLGKRGMGLNTVMAGWLRASFLKYFGWVTESVGSFFFFFVFFGSSLLFREEFKLTGI
jgi:hypothetical protein